MVMKADRIGGLEVAGRATVGAGPATRGALTGPLPRLLSLRNPRRMKNHAR
jgi:hypothetical protein